MVQEKRARKTITHPNQLRARFKSHEEASDYLDGLYISLGVGEGPVESNKPTKKGPRTHRGNRPKL
jgi:hypothetical protein